MFSRVFLCLASQSLEVSRHFFLDFLLFFFFGLVLYGSSKVFV